ncbi:unnamed protein product [Didymodactylos carnosus]|uniref:Uncharacterized protein n=1 Tax=Didymodactylos carnosus TaxID=1234261 RepID=A0A8S2KW75_9BILA|nr:unnamed protein product [Didymodactylos carnosus]CAF3872532.1 unnamed protein product [Didymodactylos carnosus]
MSKRSSSTKGTKKDGKKEKKGSKSLDVNDAKIEALIHEREAMRTKLNILCTKIIENVNVDDFSEYKDMTETKMPSDCSIQTLLAMIDQICQFRIAFLTLYSEIDNGIRVPITEKITQLAIEKPELFRKKLNPEQRLTFVMKERDKWKENAQILQIMYATIGVLQNKNIKVFDILATHRLNLTDVSLIFNSPIIQSIDGAQKVRVKKNLDNELSKLREKHAFFDLTNTEDTREEQKLQEQVQQLVSIQHNIADTFTSRQNSTSKKQIRSIVQNQNANDYDQLEQRQLTHTQSKRSVSFADEVNILNENNLSSHNNETFQTEHSHANLSSTNSSLTNVQLNNDLKTNNYDSSDQLSPTSLSSYNSSNQNQDRPKSSTMIKRLPFATTTQVTRMDPNLKMLIIKELSKQPQTNGLSRSGNYYFF